MPIAGDPVPIQQKRRYRPGATALREIREYQGHAKLVFLRLPFMRLVIFLRLSGNWCYCFSNTLT